jgi:DNA topoisomerase-2
MLPLHWRLTRTYNALQLSQIEHILKRPDSYIGSVETITQVMWTFDSDTKHMVNREVKYVPGFFKIIDEILVNAADNKVSLHYYQRALLLSSI